jgi:hypothetical protein
MEDRPMPFEIKTGRAVGVMEHRAQTMLYTLLMEERYRKAFLACILVVAMLMSLSLHRDQDRRWITLLHPD